jgi:hypothetical protein
MNQASSPQNPSIHHHTNFLHRLPPKPPSTPKPTRTPNTLLQRIHNHHLGHNNLLHNKLRNAVPNLDLEIRVGQVREDDADGAAVVCVDDARERVDAVFVCEARAGGYSAVCYRYTISTYTL